MPVTIRDVQVILAQPNLSPLAIVKVTTSEPGLYGLGCASCSRQVYAVESAIEHRLKPLVIGRDVSRIEELWQLMTFNGYWRNGPVLNNAISGIDMALWDIKGKMAGMPLYQLFGGKVREGATRVYRNILRGIDDQIIVSKADKREARKLGLKAKREPYDCITKESKWQSYEGSCENIGDRKVINKEILVFCKTKKELSYREEQALFYYGVLEDEQYLNDNIGGRYFKGDFDGS